jgi:hypothetical protein
MPAHNRRQRLAPPVLPICHADTRSSPDSPDSLPRHETAAAAQASGTAFLPALPRPGDLSRSACMFGTLFAFPFRVAAICFSSRSLRMMQRFCGSDTTGVDAGLHRSRDGGRTVVPHCRASDVLGRLALPFPRSMSCPCIDPFLERVLHTRWMNSAMSWIGSGPR